MGADNNLMRNVWIAILIAVLAWSAMNPLDYATGLLLLGRLRDRQRTARGYVV